MLPDANTKQVLIIAGMHRSGTSLLAAALGAAGVDLARGLMAAADGNNEKGFFENLDFVELHEKILQKPRAQSIRLDHRKPDSGSRPSGI